MKKIILTALFTTFLQILSWGQVNEGLIDLGKSYRQFMFRNNPPETVLSNLDKYDNTELSFVADFIQETIRPNSNVISDRYLTRPSDSDLKFIYIVRQVNLNASKEKPKDNSELVDDLIKKEIGTQELVDNYYSLLFSAYGNKVKPYDLSKTDFQLNNYGLKDETEKGIFFLVSMRLNGLLIFGYMNIVKPPNYAKASEMIDKYPTYNGSPYFQFLDLNFPDFKMKIESDGKPESYKGYYIDKYYETLLSHLDCLRNNGDKEKIYDLVLGSILHQESLFKYSKREKEIRQLLTKYKK
jgi:hypothetical protein